jgi:hypothetical protein
LARASRLCRWGWCWALYITGWRYDHAIAPGRQVKACPSSGAMPSGLATCGANREPHRRDARKPALFAIADGRSIPLPSPEFPFPVSRFPFPGRRRYFETSFRTLISGSICPDTGA